VIALCDMETFYASCELVFRPDIKNRRVVVLSNNDGCIVACSKEAKAVGVEKFTPYFQQKALLEKEQVTVFSSNYTLYGLISQRIMAILQEEAPLAEVYSIDEAFLDVAGIPDVKAFAAHLRRRVWQEQRIPMGVGVAPSKTLAKLANKASKTYEKLNGVCVLDSEYKWQWLCDRLPVTDVWGVGKGMAKRLAVVGVSTASDLASLSLSQARTIGGVVLSRTVNELNGIPSVAFEEDRPDKQEIVSSRSFGEKVTSLNAIKQAVSTYATRACEKLRKQNSVAGVLTVWVNTGRHDARQPYYHPVVHWVFDPPIDDPQLIAATASSLVASIYQDGLRYAKAGVSLSKIQPSAYQQAHLFHVPSTDDRLATVIDKINSRYGRHTVKPARQIGGLWRMNQQFRSPNYLTCWSDIPHVNC
jgi:DNA polymerase V